MSNDYLWLAAPNEGQVIESHTWTPIKWVPMIVPPSIKLMNGNESIVMPANSYWTAYGQVYWEMPETQGQNDRRFLVGTRFMQPLLGQELSLNRNMETVDLDLFAGTNETPSHQIYLEPAYPEDTEFWIEVFQSSGAPLQLYDRDWETGRDPRFPCSC